MGITNPLFPNENCPQGDCSLLSGNPAPGLNDDGAGVEAFANFMTLLAPPPRGLITNDVAAGEVIFMSLGCANCHVPALQTGSRAVKALAHQTFFPFSDFLLHDMGNLGDGIEQGQATRRAMRTAPLWGLREISARIAWSMVVLHDGRASTMARVQPRVMVSTHFHRTASRNCAAFSTRSEARVRRRSTGVCLLRQRCPEVPALPSPPIEHSSHVAPVGKVLAGV